MLNNISIMHPMDLRHSNSPLALPSYEALTPQGLGLALSIYLNKPTVISGTTHANDSASLSGSEFGPYQFSANGINKFQKIL